MVVRKLSLVLVSVILSATFGCALSAQRSKEVEVFETRDPAEQLMLSWPVSPPFQLTQKFNRFPSDPHDGIDLGGPKDSPIFAAHDGWVSYVGKDFRGYGTLVIVDSGRGWSTFYSHLNRALVPQRTRVFRGKKIGQMGKTGNARGVHLHFELRKNKVPLDPLTYLPPI